MAFFATGAVLRNGWQNFVQNPPDCVPATCSCGHVWVKLTPCVFSPNTKVILSLTVYVPASLHPNRNSRSPDPSRVAWVFSVWRMSSWYWTVRWGTWLRPALLTAHLLCRCRDWWRHPWWARGDSAGCVQQVHIWDLRCVTNNPHGWGGRAWILQGMIPPQIYVMFLWRRKRLGVTGGLRGINVVGWGVARCGPPALQLQTCVGCGGWAWQEGEKGAASVSNQVVGLALYITWMSQVFPLALECLSIETVVFEFLCPCFYSWGIRSPYSPEFLIMNYALF